MTQTGSVGMISADRDVGTPAVKRELKRLATALARALFAACNLVAKPQDRRMTTLLRWHPARSPQRRTMRGRYARLEPLDPRAHASALFAATHGPGNDPRLWDYMFVGPFASQKEFSAWLSACARSEDPLFFAIVGRKLGAAGMASFMRISPGHGVIEIGNIFLAANLQHRREATEAIFLLLRQAFERWGYRRVEWKCDSRNRRSRRAAQRFGFRFEGLFRQHMVVKGESRDTAWFAITDREWPSLARGFRRWLAPQNFDRAGQQRRKLRVRSREYSRPGQARRY
jgi:RimJ/RimL family protein N-acetyltransferase